MTKLNMSVNTALLASLLAAAGAVAAAPQGIHAYRMLAISPAGERIAAIESVASEGSGKRPHGVINVRDAASGKVLASYDPCASCSYDFPSWSPDRNALAFIASDAKTHIATLYVAADGKTTAVTTVKGVASTARWSPDGKQLALLATIGAKKQTGATEAGAALVGEIGVEEDEQRIAIVARSGGELKLVSPADTYIYEYDWTPDGKGFVVTSAKGNGDNNWWVATLGHVDAASGALRILAAPAMQMNMPRMSKDGQTVAFIGGLMSDFGSVGGDVFTVPLAGGQPTNITPGYRGSFSGLTWQGKQIVASALVGSDQADRRARPGRAHPAHAVVRAGVGLGIARRPLRVQRRRRDCRFGPRRLRARSAHRRRAPAAAGADHARQRGIRAAGVGQEHQLDQRQVQRPGLAAVAAENRSGQEVSDGGGGAWRAGVGGDAAFRLAGR